MRSALLSLILILPAVAFAHGGQEPTIVIEPEKDEVVSTNAYQYKFQLFDTERNVPVKESDLKITHEKKLHFLAYDPGLKEFQHIHPTFDGTYWIVDLNFQASGNYWLWAQGEIQNGDEFSTSARIDVRVHQPAWPAPSLSDSRSGTDGISKAVLSNVALKAGRMAMIDMTFLRIDGSTPNITPYLGALAHVVATPDDGDSLIHVHPMNGTKPNEGMLHVTFPSKGFYRLWIQFIDENVLRLVPLSVQVK